MLGSIRKLIYKIGFCPKAGSIFYSPSLDLLIQAKEAFKNFKLEKVSVLDNGPVYTSIIENNTLLKILESLMYCPMCSCDLETIFEGFTLAAKTCPKHGRVFQFFPTYNGYYRIIVNLGRGIDASTRA